MFVPLQHVERGGRNPATNTRRVRKAHGRCAQKGHSIESPEKVISFSSFDQSCAIVKIASLYVNLVRYFAYTHTYECTYTHREQIATVEKKGEEE